MISRKALEAAQAVLARYEKRTVASLPRGDRVYVQVRKEEMQLLLQLARVGLARFVCPECHGRGFLWADGLGGSAHRRTQPCPTCGKHTRRK